VLRFVDIPLGRSSGVPCRRGAEEQTETLFDTPEVLAVLLAAIESWSGGPGPNVAFTGAEPFHHPALEELISAAARAGAQRVRLDTDGAALCEDSVAHRVIDAGVRHVRFPLLGSTAELHDALIGRPGAFAATVRGVRWFADVARELGQAVQLSARVPVCHRNLKDLPAIVTRAIAAGASYVGIVLTDETLDPFAAAPWVEAACDTGIVHATWVDVEGMPFGPAEGWELHLASLYHPVAGEKSDVCSSCALEPVCGGAAAGADITVTGRLRPPSYADRLAGRVMHAYEPLAGARNG
jgi:hypothetical protein